jgi:hypothetical protein
MEEFTAFAKTFSPSEYIDGVKKVGMTVVQDTKQEVHKYGSNYRQFCQSTVETAAKPTNADVHKTMFTAPSTGDKLKFHGRNAPLFGIRMGVVGGNAVYGLGKLGVQTRFGGLVTLCLGYGVYKAVF